MAAIEIQDLTVEVNGYPIVDGLNLTIEEGECVGIFGPLPDARVLLYVFGGLLLPTSGAVWVYNEPPRRALERGLIQLLSPLAEELPPAPIILAESPSFIPLSSKSQTVVCVTRFIDFFYKLIEKNYKSIVLREGRDCG